MKIKITRGQERANSVRDRANTVRGDRPTPDAIRLRKAPPQGNRESVRARRAESFLRGDGGAMLWLLMGLYDGQPVDLQFGDKIIHFEVRDTVDEPPEEASAPPRGRTNAD